MIRKVVAVALLASAALPAFAQQAAKFNTTTTLLGAILDNPAAKAAFAKVVPELAANPQLEMGREMTLTAIAEFAPEALTADKLKELEAELAKVE